LFSRDSPFNLGRSCLRRCPLPREDRRAGGGVTCAPLARERRCVTIRSITDGWVMQATIRMVPRRASEQVDIEDLLQELDHPLPPPCSPCPCAQPMNAGDVAGCGPYRNLPRPPLMFRSRVPLRSLSSTQSPSDEMHYLSSRSYLL